MEFGAANARKEDGSQTWDLHFHPKAVDGREEGGKKQAHWKGGNGNLSVSIDNMVIYLESPPQIHEK